MGDLVSVPSLPKDNLRRRAVPTNGGTTPRDNVVGERAGLRAAEVVIDNHHGPPGIWRRVIQSGDSGSENMGCPTLEGSSCDADPIPPSVKTDLRAVSQEAPDPTTCQDQVDSLSPTSIHP